jgi:hypothetical protein
MWGDGNWVDWVVGVKDLGFGHVDVMTILGGLVVGVKELSQKVTYISGGKENGL